MYTGMEWWSKIRLEVLRGEKSKREVLRDEGIHWETLKRILKYSEPPGYRLKVVRPKPKIGSYLGRFTKGGFSYIPENVKHCESPGRARVLPKA